MKKNLIILGTTLAGVTGVFAQGVLTGAATLKAQAGPGSVDFHIYGPETDNPGTRISGNISSAYSTTSKTGDSPVGTAAYNGSLIGGNSSGTGQYQFSNGNFYEMEVAAVQGSGPVGTANLIPATVENFSINAGNAGEFANEIINVPGTSSTQGDTAEFQIYAWYEGANQYTSYNAALAAGVPAGFSDPFSGATTAPPGTPGLLTNPRSFNLTSTTSTPEPSTIALGIMGASAFLMRRRTSK